MSIKNLQGWVGLQGEENSMWKGNKAGYRALHYWVRRHCGEPIKCAECGKVKTSPKSIQWANKSGTHRRDTSDWINLCVPCHRRLDECDSTRKKLLDNLCQARLKRWAL